MKELRDWLIMGALALLLSLFMLDLSRPGLPMFHDSNPHIARSIAYHTALTDGQFPPMWAKEVLGGIGSPVLMLNYQLPYALGEIWHRLGLSYFDSYKLSLGFSFVLSGVLMYLALRVSTGRLAAWTGALIYTLAPYRFVDIYVRGALGESLAFIFPPILIWGFARASLPVLVIGWAGLFLTHPLASAAFAAFFLGHALWLGEKKSRRERLRLYGISFGTALLLAAFNLVPTLSLTKDTYYSPALSGTFSMFPTLSQLWQSAWGYGVSMPGAGDGMSFEVGKVQWLVIVVAVVWVLAYKHKAMRYLTISTGLALFLILPLSAPIYRALQLTRIIDFPWRLLLCVVFAAAWMGAEIIHQYTNKPIHKFWIVGIIMGGLIFQSLPMAKTDRYWEAEQDVQFFARETGDSYGEYAPLSRATRNSSPFGKRAELVEGEGTVEVLSDKSNEKILRVTSQNDGVVRVNTAYFPGWVMPTNCVVTKRTLTHIDDSGLMACPVHAGEQILSLKFMAPPSQRLGNLITWGGIGAYLWILCRSFSRRLTSAKR